MDSVDIRRNHIAEWINEKGEISFGQLKEKFPNVSEMTLRTDLKHLNEEKRIVRVYGGAKSVDAVIGTDDFLGRRSVRNVEEKKTIAAKAVQLIKPNTTIFLDSGSTTTLLASLIPDQPNLIITSSISCAMELSHLEKPRVILTGGTLNRFSLSICGIHAIQEISRMNFDVAFLGVTTYAKEIGFACNVEEEAALKQAAMKRAQNNVALMDSTKIGKRSSFSFCGLADVDAVVSDGQLPEDFSEACRAHGVIIY